MNKHGEFIWYELMTKDSAKAEAFYGPVVGWTFQEMDPDNTGYRLFLADGVAVGGLMPLTDAMCAGGAAPAWMGYVGVDDVDASAKAAQDTGGRQYVPPTDIPNVGRFAMLADPQGAPFYVMRGASPERSRAFEMNGVGHCQWNELYAAELDGAFGFYAGLFGWAKGEEMDMGEMGPYRFFEVDGQAIGAMMNTPPGARGGWVYYFGVADIDAAAAKVAELGGVVTFGPSEVPGGSRIIMAKDPEGSTFGLVG